MNVPVNPIVSVPEGTKKGWTFKIDGQPVEFNHLVGHNPRVGYLLYGYNGRYDQPAILQNPGRMVVYICNHPVHGLLMAGGDEPRVLANGSMFTPAGGFDSNADNAENARITSMPNGPDKKAALEKYQETQAAREVLEETGLPVTKLNKVGYGISNRAFFIADLTDDEWTCETFYAVMVSPNVIVEDDGRMVINLPKDKMGDVMPAPEWSNIEKLEFKPLLDCFDSPDLIAVGCFAKAYAWFMRPKMLSVNEALQLLEDSIRNEMK